MKPASNINCTKGKRSGAYSVTGRQLGPRSNVVALYSFLVVSFASIAAASPENSSAKERFLSEAPSSWTRLMSEMRRLQGHFESKCTIRGSNLRIASHERCELKQAVNSALCSIQYLIESDKPVQHSVLYAVNPNYSFELRRRTPNERWVLANTIYEANQTNKPDSKMAPFRRPMTATWLVQSVVSAPLAVFDCEDDWPKMISDPAVELVNVTNTVVNGSSMVQVEYLTTWSITKDHLRKVRRGTATFDPNCCWVMRNSSFVVDTWQAKPRILVRTYDYRTDRSSFPILSKLVEREVNSSNGDEIETLMQFDLVPAVVAQSEFTLAAFGLPNPNGMALPGDRNWWFWTPVGLALLLILYLVSRKTAKRDHNLKCQ